MCFTLQRYKFSSKSQPSRNKIRCAWRCVLPCKGTNFQANHNHWRNRRYVFCDVFYLAKVQIFKQITTRTRWMPWGSGMCFTLQRYKFSSKSQLHIQLKVPKKWCVLPCKGTNFQANHNPCLPHPPCQLDVFYLAKVQIFKQITTLARYGYQKP